MSAARKIAARVSRRARVAKCMKVGLSRRERQAAAKNGPLPKCEFWQWTLDSLDWILTASGSYSLLSRRAVFAAVASPIGRSAADPLVHVPMRLLEGQGRVDHLLANPHAVGRLRIALRRLRADVDLEVLDRFRNVHVRVILH